MAERIIPLRLSDFSGPAPNVEKCQCWLCANEKAALAAENERLRAVIERVYQSSNQPHIIEMTRAALEGK